MTYFFFFLFSFFTSDEILNSAEQNGFYYKNVAIQEVSSENCQDSMAFVKKEGFCWQLVRQDETIIDVVEKENSLILNLVPDAVFSRYYLYVQNSSAVNRFVLKSRKIEIKNNAKITSFQIVGVGEKGPVVLFQKNFKKNKKSEFKESIEKSLEQMRSLFNLFYLKKDSELDVLACKRCRDISESAFSHYNSANGSVAHNNLKLKVVGENLFIAEDENKAWDMMLNSPSHLFNIIYPYFTKYGLCIKKKNNKIQGAIIFGR